MEGRIIKLEAHMEHVREDLKSLADVPKDLATLTAHVAHLPSKGFIVSVLTTGVAVIGGLVLMADRIKNLF
ncbi:hypothetical protein NX02_22050 [Sphingomonas sanxanigenens DSM 19645 = NX02]|uniref:Uncharacterized protein n=2 Tax=Sphingomonas sanxanigenens TaxID=397260 RepID=W0AG12_9SPHN|nr:hypothetical protein NX02_04295 [Sphingomonas sanxanigenens DSM 19645 = NX02]AHE56036.1 hypothetical protein NX02_22050 [Sphingomonas sanxanigenens DSM 19645 = NX02]